MGWTPAEVDACFLWDFVAAFRGWKSFHSAPNGPRPPTADEFDAAVAADMSPTIH